jgi:hypothetical protein
MKLPSDAGRPPGQSTLEFSSLRHSRAVAHGSVVVVVGPPGVAVVVVVGVLDGVVVVVEPVVGSVVVVVSGCATSANGDSEVTVTQAYRPSMRVSWSTNALPTSGAPRAC